MRRVECTGSQTAWRVAMDRVSIGQQETKSTRMNEGRSENGLWLLGNARKRMETQAGHGCLPFGKAVLRVFIHRVRVVETIYDMRDAIPRSTRVTDLRICEQRLTLGWLRQPRPLLAPQYCTNKGWQTSSRWLTSSIKLTERRCSILSSSPLSSFSTQLV